MTLKRVVVTGLGTVNPIGHSVEEFWESALAGKSGGAEITKFDTVRHKTKFACEVKNFDATKYLDAKAVRRTEMFVVLALVAAREALADSGMNLDEEDRNQVGAIVGSGIGGLQSMEDQTRIMLEGGPGRVSPFLITRLITNMAAGQLSMDMGLKGPNNCPVTACATGNHAIGDAFKIIQRGQAIALFAGGTESAITPLGLAGFENMKALSGRNDSPATASRPFDKERDGFVMGEGAGVLLLEEYEHAKARGARIYGEIAGYGLTADAHHVTAPAPGGEGAARAIGMALEDAGLKATDVDYVNAHGTSTPLNDKSETQALKAILGDYAYKIPVSSIKSMTGHLLGAAGGVEAVASFKTIETGMIPPTINYQTPDPDCDLDYCPNEKREAKVDVVISNSFGFGGHNTSLVFRRVVD